MPYLDDVITRHRVTVNVEATENALSDWFRDFVSTDASSTTRR
jgi:hypothetical protein